MAMENLDHKEIIGKRLESLRLSRKRGYKRVDVAHELNMSASTYSDWEGGRRGPNGGKLVELAKYYNTTVDFITGLTDDDSPIDKNLIKERLKSAIYGKNGAPLTPREIEELDKAINEALYPSKVPDVNQ